MTSIDPQPKPDLDRVQHAAGHASDGGGEVAVVNSADLFKGATELRVRHRGDEYRLRITRQGKLILTK